MDIELKVSGLKELNDALKALPREVSEKLLNGAVAKAAAVIRDETKLRAPIALRAHFNYRGMKAPPGTLRRAVYAVHVKEMDTFFHKLWRVGVRHGRLQQKSQRDAFYWWWVENGHKFVARRGRGLGTIRSRRAAATTRVPAYPFLRPAFEAKKDAAVEALRAYLAEAIPRTAARLNRRGF